MEFIAVIFFAALTWLFFKFRNKKTSNTNAPQAIKPAQASTTPTTIKPVSEPATSTPTPALDKTTSQPKESIVHQTENKPSTVEQTCNKNNTLPQDSMLRRHYLTNLRATLVSLSPERPTDSALSRHYDALIASKMDECLSNEIVLCDKSVEPVAEVSTPSSTETPLIVTTIITTQKTVSKIPEDATLRRHYFTQLYAQVAAELLPRPTDATLRRHYDTMLEMAVQNQLANN